MRCRRWHIESVKLQPVAPPLQGPALLCHNDAVFSPADFRNISRIGQDSKLASPTAVGRFGLGFNSAYSYTDVPSFVSGDYLVVFDPHARWAHASCRHSIFMFNTNR